MRFVVTSFIASLVTLGACAKGQPGPACADFIAKLDKICADPAIASTVSGQCSQARTLLDAGASQGEWDRAESLCASQVSMLDRALPMLEGDKADGLIPFQPVPAEGAPPAEAPADGEPGIAAAAPGPACGELGAAITKHCTSPSATVAPACDAFKQAWRSFEKAAAIAGWAQIEDTCKSQKGTITMALEAASP